MSKIFVPHYTPRFDYSAATQFGELQPVTDRAYSFNSESMGQQVLLADMVRAASVYDEFEDYLLLGGVPLNTAHFIQLLTNRGIRTIRSLVWNSNDGAYTVGMYTVPGDAQNV